MNFSDKSPMSRRPAIPVDVQRDLMIECGHRCACCGEPVALERAHIVPWHESRDHNPDNLIVLCATCHTRSHDEMWDRKTLQKYKQRPFILRHSFANTGPGPQKMLQLTLDCTMEEFEDARDRVIAAVAAVINARTEDVVLISVERGSVRLTLRVPEGNTKGIVEAGDQFEQLMDLLKPLKLVKARDLSAGPFADLSKIVGASKAVEVLNWLGRCDIDGSSHPRSTGSDEEPTESIISGVRIWGELLSLSIYLRFEHMALAYLINDLENQAWECRRERVYSFRVGRRHRRAIDEAIQRFLRMTAPLPNVNEATSIRLTTNLLISELYKMLPTLLPTLDISGIGLNPPEPTDWSRRLEEVANALDNLCNELKLLREKVITLLQEKHVDSQQIEGSILQMEKMALRKAPTVTALIDEFNEGILQLVHSRSDSRVTEEGRLKVIEQLGDLARDPRFQLGPPEYAASQQAQEVADCFEAGVERIRSLWSENETPKVVRANCEIILERARSCRV